MEKIVINVVGKCGTGKSVVIGILPIMVEINQINDQRVSRG